MLVSTVDLEGGKGRAEVRVGRDIEVGEFQGERVCGEFGKEAKEFGEKEGGVRKLTRGKEAAERTEGGREEGGGGRRWGEGRSGGGMLEARMSKAGAGEVMRRARSRASMSRWGSIEGGRGEAGEWEEPGGEEAEGEGEERERERRTTWTWERSWEPSPTSWR
jgi:hypothetical protein